jgi:uncharacterized membrane protein YbaN (DUF454 family)
VKTKLYKPLGFLFLGLAIVGVLLPVLPGTPFLLLSAWFFARSSEKWHQRLLRSELFGPLLRNWERDHCISCRTKLAAVFSMVLAGGASILFAVQDERIRIAALCLMAVGVITLLSIKTCAGTITGTITGTTKTDQPG